MLQRQAFVVGRFQPVHKGHVTLIRRALELSENVVIFIGSAQEDNTPKNPYDVGQRVEMIKACFDQEVQKRLVFMPLPDFATNTEWVKFIDHSLKCYSQKTVSRISVVTDKDADTQASNQVLRQVPYTDQYVCVFPNTLNATDIRKKIFIEGEDPMKIHELYPAVRALIKQYMDKD